MELFKDEKVFCYLLKNWEKLEEIVKILKIFYETTVKLQKPNYTLSDFYGDWLFLDLKLKQMAEQPSVLNINLSRALLKSLHDRKESLISNKAMLCTVYLDPRFKSNLKADEIALVNLLLCDMKDDLKKIKQLSDNSVIENLSSECENNDLLETYLAQIDSDSSHSTEHVQAIQNENQSHSADYIRSTNDFRRVIEQYENNTARLHHSSSVLEFWENSKDKFAELYEVASVYLSIPPTQATVERTFSVLGFVFNNRRFNLSRVILEAIMIIKMNKDLAEVIFTEELNEI